MARKHITIFPSGQGVDFYRAERSYDGVWLRSSVASWITILLPAVLQGIEAADFTFSSFREIPCGDPSLMPLPAGSGCAVKVFAPCGGFYPGQWGSVVFYGERHEPIVGGERFVPTNGGIKRQVQEFLNADLIDSLRKPDRPRTELWIRHDLKIADMLADAYDAPRWLRETQGLNPEEAAAKLTALRTPKDPNEYFRIRAQQRDAAEAERLKANEDGTGSQVAASAEAEPVTPAVMSMAEKTEKRKTRERLKRATQSKVAADRANAAAADEWAAKRVKQLTAQGKL